MSNFNVANFIVAADNFVELRDQQKNLSFVAVSLESIEQLNKNRESAIKAKGLIYIDTKGIGKDVEFLKNEFVISTGDQYVNPKSITDVVCTREFELMWAINQGFKYITISSPLNNDIPKLEWIAQKWGVKFVLKDANSNKNCSGISPTWVGPAMASSERMSKIFEFYHLGHSNLENSNLMVRAYAKAKTSLPLYKVIDGLSEEDGDIVESLVDPMFDIMRESCLGKCMSCTGCKRYLKVYEPFKEGSK